MRVEDIVNIIVDNELQGKGRDNEALSFQFQLSMFSFTNGEKFREYIARRNLYLLYYMNSGHHSISVFSAVTFNMHGVQPKKITEWKHESTHDTCWRNTQTFSRVYFDMAEEVNEKRVEDGFEKEAPALMHEHNQIPFVNNLFSWIPVKVVNDPSNHYHRLVEVL